MRIAFVGCGYAADLYASTLSNHPSLTLHGVHDRDPVRQRAFSDHHKVRGYPTLERLLTDPDVELVVNLTNPTSHAEITQAALLANKHVYSEKPLALDLNEARHLVKLADTQHLGLSSAPSTLLGEAAQTVWLALRAGAIGTPRLAYGELDAGPLLRLPFKEWFSASGAPWPYLDEFRTGCTIEHGAYCLSWLTAFFGPATLVTALTAPTVPNPELEASGTRQTPNFSLAGIRFTSGVLARVTTGLAAPRDQSLRIIGDEGVLAVIDGGHFESPVTLTLKPGDEPIHLPLARERRRSEGYNYYHHIDFARGVADLADALADGQPRHLPTDHALHILELTLAIAAATDGTVMRPETLFEPVPPVPWAD